MKRLNDSTWERDPQTALNAMRAAINKDEANGYLTQVEANHLRNKANALYRKHTRKNGVNRGNHE